MDSFPDDAIHRVTTETSPVFETASDTPFSIEAFLAHIETLPKGEPLTYGATPLDRIATLQQQIELAETLRTLTLTNIPEEMPSEIVKYIKPTFSERFHSRGEANEENYLSALLRKDAYADSPEITAMIERGEQGYASAGELLAIRSLLGVRSVELGCVSHPYGNRMESVYEMRSTIRKHIEALGGVYDDEPEVRYRVKKIICPNHENTLKHAVGFLMTKKTTLGMMSDGTMIRERASFVLRADVPGVKDHFAEMGAVIDAQDYNWQEELVAAGNLQPIVDDLMQRDDFLHLVPISSTIYAFNAETAAEVYKKQQEELDERRQKFEEEYPELARHIREAQEAHEVEADTTRVTEITNRMYYNGPPLS